MAMRTRVLPPASSCSRAGRSVRCRTISELISFRIIDERRFNARNELITLSEATIKVEVGGAQRMIVAEGNGPVNALDHALRQALSATFPGSSICIWPTTRCAS